MATGKRKIRINKDNKGLYAKKSKNDTGIKQPTQSVVADDDSHNQLTNKVNNDEFEDTDSEIYDPTYTSESLDETTDSEFTDDSIEHIDDEEAESVVNDGGENEDASLCAIISPPLSPTYTPDGDIGTTIVSVLGSRENPIVITE
jgi:hypothetical protein